MIQSAHNSAQWDQKQTLGEKCLIFHSQGRLQNINHQLTLLKEAIYVENPVKDGIIPIRGGWGV